MAVCEKEASTRCVVGWKTCPPSSAFTLHSSVLHIRGIIKSCGCRFPTFSDELTLTLSLVRQGAISLPSALPITPWPTSNIDSALARILCSSLLAREDLLCYPWITVPLY